MVFVILEVVGFKITGGALVQCLFYIQILTVPTGTGYFSHRFAKVHITVLVVSSTAGTKMATSLANQPAIGHQRRWDLDWSLQVTRDDELVSATLQPP